LATSSSSDLWALEPDGRIQRQILQHIQSDGQAHACPDRDDVVFTSKRNAINTVWRVRPDGSEMKQLTFGGNDQFPRCIAGGTVLYLSQSNTGYETLQAPLDGGAAVKASHSVWEEVSRDGRSVLQEATDERTHTTQTVVRTRPGGVTTAAFPYNDIQIASWAPDGHGFAFVSRRSGVHEIWYQALEGGAPRQLTHFGGDEIFSIDWSPDSRRLVLARGRFISDMVLIKEAP
jgi:Tol biopolymer transport system component